MRKDDVLPLLGEGFLMALRRAVPDSLVASKIHGLITKMLTLCFLFFHSAFLEN